MKKWLSLILCAIMMLSLVPASAAELEPMELSVAVWDVENAKLDAEEPDDILKMIQEKFNVTFVPMNIGWGDYSEKYMTWAAGGTLPDICGGIDYLGSSTYYQWCNDGVIRALPEDLSAYPNVEKYVSMSDVQAVAVDGENYLLPRMTYVDASWQCMDRGMLIRKDWLEALGLEMPKNKEDLLPIAEAFATKDPDGDGLNNTIGIAYEAVFPLSQQIAAFGNTDSRWVKDENGVWEQPIYEDDAIELIDFLRTCYKNGWMDQDFASRKTNDVQNLFASGSVGMLCKQNSPKHIKAIYDTWVVNQPDKNFEDCVAIVAFEDEDCVAFAEKAFWSETYIGGHVEDDKMERILMLFDWLYSDEAFKLTSYGIEGVDYTVDANGEITITRPLNESGNNFVGLSTIYPSVSCFGQLAQWNGDLGQYDDPTIPAFIREMCTAERERRISTWKNMNVDWVINTMNLPEKDNFSGSSNTWKRVVADTSDKTTEELYQELRAEWDVQGYQALKDAVNAAAAELGR